MIKVITGYKVKAGADIQPMLMKLRSYAMTSPGFVSAENLLRTQDGSIIAMVSTWEKIEDWKMWEKTKIRKQILQEARKFLVGEPRVTMYKVMPTTRWTYTPLGY
jgi:heme-degrading monooxygenase HmoA